MKGSKFIFNSVDLLYYDFLETSLRRGELVWKEVKWFDSSNMKRIIKDHF